MHIEIRPSSTGMTRARSRELALRLKAAFARMTHLISRVVVRVGDATRNGSTTRECTVEIHLPNGEVTVINERQRKLGALVRRATERAWKAATHAVGLPQKNPRPGVATASRKAGAA
jgi:hypothetical protein